MRTCSIRASDGYSDAMSDTASAPAPRWACATASASRRAAASPVPPGPSSSSRTSSARPSSRSPRARTSPRGRSSTTSRARRTPSSGTPRSTSRPRRWTPPRRGVRPARRRGRGRPAFLVSASPSATSASARTARRSSCASRSTRAPAGGPDDTVAEAMTGAVRTILARDPAWGPEAATPEAAEMLLGMCMTGCAARPATRARTPTRCAPDSCDHPRHRHPPRRGLTRTGPNA